MSNEIAVKAITSAENLPVDITNLKLSPDELFNALGAALPINKHLGMPLLIKGHVVGKTMITNDDGVIDPETGELKQKEMDVIYLFTDKEIYFSVSGTLIRRYLQLIALTGMPKTWDKPKSLVFTKETMGKKQVYNVQIKLG